MSKHEHTLIKMPRRKASTLLRPEVALWVAAQGMAIAATVVTALLMSGCAGFSGITPKATPVAVDTLASARTVAALPGDGNWPAANWWQAYGDAQLDALVAEALAGNPGLRVAEARLARANAAAGLAESAARPGISASFDSSRQKFSQDYIYPLPLAGAVNSLNLLQLNFSYDLDLWGRNRALIGAAGSQVQASAADAQAARLALTTAVTRAWFALQRLAALREVTAAAIQQRDQILSLTRQRASAGLDTNVELRQAEAALPSARVDLAQVDEAIALTRNQIAALVGKGPDRGLDVAIPAPTRVADAHLPAVLSADLLGRRPDLVAARWRVEAARGEIDAAKAQFYPNINLVGFVGLNSVGLDNLLKSRSQAAGIGPAISLPLFSGTLRSNLRGRDADYDAAVEQYNQVLVDALRDVADQVAALRSVAAQRADQSLARARTEQAYDLAMQRYKAGIGTYLTVLIAESAVLTQQRADAELRARALDVDVSLIRALGGGYAAPLPAETH